MTDLGVALPQPYAAVSLDLDVLAQRVAGLAEQRVRTVIGIAGEPGSGKSTVAAELAEKLVAQGISTVVVPMDGFHLAGSELARLGLAHRKGAVETFDVAGYLALLDRLATPSGDVVYAPAYVRGLEEGVAGSIAVPADTMVVITEGNYLLVDQGLWRGVHERLSEAWFLDADPTIRRERLIARHVQHGRHHDEAADWVVSVDEPNAVLVRESLDRADVIITPAP